MAWKNPTVNESALQTRDDIWNEVINAISENVSTDGNDTAANATTVFYYYSAMETGGHECWLNWQEQRIREVGFKPIVAELSQALHQMNAHEHEEIISHHGQSLWETYDRLESNPDLEEDFYKLVEKADTAYSEANPSMQELIEIYFEDIHKELIDIR